MVSVNRSLRYLLLFGSAVGLAGGLSSAAFADGDILPPPPPDEDTPKPVFDPTKYVQYYPPKTTTRTSVTTIRATPLPTLPSTPQVVTTGSTIPLTRPTTTTTTTTTVQAAPPPVVPVGTTTTTTRVTGSAPVAVTPSVPATTVSVGYRPANAAAQALLNRAYDMMRKNDFAGSVRLLDEAVRLDANSVVARRYLAYALIRISRPGEALNQLVVLANMLKPGQPTAFDQLNFGQAYLALRNFGAAEEALRTVVAVEPKNDAARGDLIKAYAYDQKFPEAMSQLTIGQQNRDPRVQRYYRTLLELIYNAKTAGTVGSAPNAVVAPAETTTGKWQQVK